MKLFHDHALKNKVTYYPYPEHLQGGSCSQASSEVSSRTLPLSESPPASPLTSGSATTSGFTSQVHVPISQQTKLFVGQVCPGLLSDNCVRLLWVAEHICGVSRVLRVEPLGRPGTFTGCAWMFVAGEADKEALLRRSKGMLCDVGGMWVAESDKERQSLTNYIAGLKKTKMKCREIPRDSIVIEVPRTNSSSGGGSTSGGRTTNSSAASVSATSASTDSSRVGQPPQYNQVPPLPPHMQASLAQQIAASVGGAMNVLRSDTTELMRFWTCPQYHPLAPRPITDANTKCSLCGQIPRPGSVVGTCRMCEFDLCEWCVKGGAVPPQSPQQQQIQTAALLQRNMQIYGDPRGAAARSGTPPQSHIVIPTTAAPIVGAQQMQGQQQPTSATAAPGNRIPGIHQAEQGVAGHHKIHAVCASGLSEALDNFQSPAFRAALARDFAPPFDD